MASPLRTQTRPPAGTTVPAGQPPDPLDIPRAPLSIRTLTGRGNPRRQGPAGQERPQVDAVDRVRGEFVEMRGFSPTPAQAARLFNLSPEECDRILARLVAEGFLLQSADGRYRSLRT